MLRIAKTKYGLQDFDKFRAEKNNSELLYTFFPEQPLNTCPADGSDYTEQSTC